MAVLEELEALCRDKTVHEFLQQEVVEGFHDHEAFVQAAEEDLLDALDEEIRDSMGMVSESQYRELFDRYLSMVSSWVKGERIRNRVTGASEPPDEGRMKEFERIVTSAQENRDDFRRSLIAAVGAFRVDHPGAEVDSAAIFPDLFRRLREHYFEERKREISRSKDHLLRYISGELGQLDDRARRDVERTLATLRERYGYCEHCGRDAVLYLLRRRYEA
jgi:predicted Ser/Thr protein kinase